ncbi:IS3 family transposase [Leuconostoc citreum]|uniref:IS3 family transposase n=1 Tax=Leuconostoc citreum TaxID=33964 RepID=UPI0037C0FBCF
MASLKVIHARNPSFLGTQYTKIKSARKICTRTYRTIDDVRASVEWYVNWYNNERINSRIEWLQAS